MPVIVTNNEEKKEVSNLGVVADVFSIFILGVFLLILMTTYTHNIQMFVLAIAVYFIGVNFLVILYMSMIKDKTIIRSLQHRLLNFIGIYNIFLGLFLIVLSFFITGNWTRVMSRPYTTTY